MEEGVGVEGSSGWKGRVGWERTGELVGEKGECRDTRHTCHHTS